MSPQDGLMSHPNISKMTRNALLEKERGEVTQGVSRLGLSYTKGAPWHDLGHVYSTRMTH